MLENEEHNKYVEKLEERMGLPSGFLDELDFEQDWSFVIRSHAFVEAVIATFLTEATDQRLEDVFSHLVLGGGRSGKLAFAEALNLLDPACIQFARRLSSLRNTLVHNVKNVYFTFEEYTFELSASDRRNFIRDITAPFPEFEDFLAANGGAEFRMRAKMVAHFSLVALVSDGYFRLHPDEGDLEEERAMLSVVLGALLHDLKEDHER